MNQTERKEDIVQMTCELSKYKTTARHVDQQIACIEHIAESFKDVFNVKKYTLHDKPALVLSTEEGVVSDVIISGHIDVVSADEELFLPTVKDEKIFGRGVYDMKGPLSAALYAAQDAVLAGSKKTISILITADEEVDGRGTKALLSEKGYRSKFTLIPDGGDEEHFVIAQKGFAQIAVSILGKSAHASRPWEGVNPIQAASDLIKTMTSRYPMPESSDEWSTTVTCTKIEAGADLNQIPDTAKAYFDIRYVDESELDEIKKFIENKLGAQVQVETVAENGMFFVDENNPEVQTLREIVHAHTGVLPELSRECGTSDAIFFTEQDIPTVLFRPKGGGEHTNEEWVDVDSLGNLHKVIYEYLMR